MKYQVVERNQKHVDAISRALKKAKALFLATDPDREGEAISWHLHELLKAQGELKGKEVQRVVFYEITKNAVREAMAQPARAVGRPGERAAGAPRAGFSGRLQSLAAAVEEGAPGPVGRPRAESRRCA